MNKEAIDLLISKNPRLKGARESLEAMQPGAYVIHRSWGMGRIKDYDEREQRLIIDFEEKPGDHPMDPAFCVGRLDVLPENSILVRHKENPEEVEKMIKESRTDIIVEVLRHSPDQSAVATEIERQLSRLMGEKKFKKWWTQTKKDLVKDPRIAVPAKKTEPYILRDEPIRAEDEVLEVFFETKAPKKKIEYADKLLALSVKHEDIKEALPDILKELTESIKNTKQLDQAERLYGVWVRNDLARFIHEDPETLEPTSASILRDESMDLASLADEVPASHQKRFLNLIERTFPDKWEDIHLDLLRKSEGRFTTEVVNYLMEKDLTKKVHTNLRRGITEQSLRAPVLYWIAKNRNSRKFNKIVADLVGPRLLATMFYAIENEALQNASSRRIPLAELLVDDQELIGELLQEASPEEAYDLATTLMLNQGFEELSKKSILARFIKRFPHIQSIVSGEEGPQQKGLVVSKSSLEARKAEYDDLIQNKIPENKEAIATAREHGDLRENAEYKMARQEQETLLARRSQLEVDLARAETTDFKEAPTDVVGIGSVVDLLQGSSDEIVTYAILGAWDSNPEKHILSYETPLARNLISRKPGATVKIEVDGNEEEWTIKDIRRWIDEKEKF